MMDNTSWTHDAVLVCSLEESRSGLREEVCSINRWVKSTSLDKKRVATCI